MTTEFYKEKRGARVYLDMARNTWAQTAVPTVCRAGPFDRVVAVPLAWDELDTTVPDAWTVRTIAERLTPRPVGRDRDTSCVHRSAQCLGRASDLISAAPPGCVRDDAGSPPGRHGDTPILTTARCS